mmetsp:Transcript_31948/g.52739  ORF Transcript_31948/g.52739 Transcript_31948/m.52739 type:complete len:443 (-) Transcript_31948:25-1353(-)
MPSLKALRKTVSKRFGRKKRSLIPGGASAADSNEAPFPILDLSDDLILHVLSFVSSAPFESNDDDEEPLFKAYNAHESARIHGSAVASPFQSAGMSYQIYQTSLRKCVEEMKLTLSTFGTLTHVLPLVCKRFQELCQLSDTLWKEAMERLIVVYPKIWGKGIHQLCDGEKTNDKDICLRASTSCGGSKFAFQRVVEVYQPFITTLPLFVIGGRRPPVLGESWHLHLVEPRCRLMIVKIMEPYPFPDKKGNAIASPGRPRFLISSGLSFPVVGGDPVFVVEIERCKLKRDGTVRLSIVIVLQTRILSIKVKPNAFDMLGATVQTTKLLSSEGLIRLPVFTSVTATQLAPPLFYSIELNFSEAPHQLMIRELMADGTLERPKFIFNHAGASGELALLVEIRNCVVYADGTANVEVVGVAKGTLQDPVERPDSHRLFDATFIHSQ